MAIWGDSSGGHSAVFVGVTGDDEFNTGVHEEYSSQVNCVVDWFGPSDLVAMGYYPSIMDHAGASSPEGMLIGRVNIRDNTELAYQASPITYINEENDTPPMLIMHGSADNIMPFNQSVRLYEKLREFDRDVTMYKAGGRRSRYGRLQQ